MISLHNCYLEYKKFLVEIWHDKTIFTVTKQLEFYLESGVFANKKDALILIQKVKELSKMLLENAEDSRKLKSDTGETYQLYSSEVVLGNKLYLLKVADTSHAYVSFNTMNSLNTSNSEFCEETEHWVKNIIKKSTLISGVAEKQRYQFFNKLNTAIDNCEARLNSF
ncbi:MAG: hypothetical protein IPJ60_18325 [Sphingobacteriaceae bacterium]|nr:hypothetical protein [Sphingobacteriaceae bacterium]